MTNHDVAISQNYRPNEGDFHNLFDPVKVGWKSEGVRKR